MVIDIHSRENRLHAPKKNIMREKTWDSDFTFRFSTFLRTILPVIHTNGPHASPSHVVVLVTGAINTQIAENWVRVKNRRMWW